MGTLSGKAAVVTGGSRGIGLAITEALLREGAGVGICGRDPAALEAAVSEMAPLGRVCGIPADVGQVEDVRLLFAFAERELGGVDILVNNAGVGHFAAVDELGTEEWDEVLATNLSGPFYCSRQAIPLMKRRGGGFILNIGSLAGKHPFATGAAYNASKFGLVGLTEAMMLDLRYSNIRVSSIMPGSVQTEFRGRSTEGGDWKLDSRAIASMAVHLVTMPDRNLASRIEMRPSRPPRR